jgi:hypothetical protein
VQRLRKEVATWRELAPAVGALRAPELRDRHWERAQELLGGGLAKGGEGVTLAALVEMQVRWAQRRQGCLPYLGRLLTRCLLCRRG